MFDCVSINISFLRNSRCNIGFPRFLSKERLDAKLTPMVRLETEPIKCQKAQLALIHSVPKIMDLLYYAYTLKKK